MIAPMIAPAPASKPTFSDVSAYLKSRARWSPFEIAFWVFAFATIWLFPGKYLILKDTAILALFALSLDLILGYAGILSLGQAAFFGISGYFAGSRRPGRGCARLRHQLSCSARLRPDAIDGDARRLADAVRSRQPLF